MDLVTVLSEKLDGFKWSGEEWAGCRCPFPAHDDPTPSFRINLSKGFYYCFGCQRSGSIAELLSILGLPPVRIDKILSSIKFIKEIKREHHVEVLPEYILAAFRRCPKQLLKAGFKKDLLKDNDIGFDLSTYTPTYPLRDKDGVLRAVYRRTSGEPKYLVYDFEQFEDYKPFPKKHLWGLHKVFAKHLYGVSPSPLVITEGFKACLWVMQAGYDAIATMGTAMTRDQADLIKLLDAPTLLMYDNDDAGWIGAASAYRKLRKAVTDIKFCTYKKHQPDNLTEEEIHETINNPKNISQWRRECPKALRKDLKALILGRGSRR